MPREIIHRGRKIQVVLDTSVGPGGEIIRRDMILHPGAVVILPVINRDHICLLRNFRFVIGETLWEVPAGTLEPGEPIEKAAEPRTAGGNGLYRQEMAKPRFSVRLARRPRRETAPFRGGRSDCRAGASRSRRAARTENCPLGRGTAHVARRHDQGRQNDYRHFVMGTLASMMVIPVLAFVIAYLVGAPGIEVALAAGEGDLAV